MQLMFGIHLNEKQYKIITTFTLNQMYYYWLMYLRILEKLV